MITPREMLRDYMTVLHILMQNSNVTFEEVLGSAVTLKTEQSVAEEEEAKAANSVASRPATVNFRPEDIDF
jgi:hypothetical protein